MTQYLEHYLTHLPEVIILCAILIAGISIGFYYAAKLKSNEALWKLALEGTGDGVWDWDMVQDVAHFSDSYKTMFGFDDAEIKLNLQTWKNRIYPDDLKSMDKAVNDYLAGKTDKYIHEHRIICKDQSVKWVLSRGMTVKHDKHGKPLRMVGTHTDITERKLLETRLENLAHFDTLTGLPNRTLFGDRLKLAVAYAKREKKMLAVMFVDLDQFKEINDLYGHKIGDKVLKKASQRLSACVRESDTVCRIGGDEFIVLLPLIDSEVDATHVANKIVSAVARPIEIVKSSEISQPIKVIQKNLHVSASIGISIYPIHGKDEKLLTINADLAMYQAKRNGKNQAILFDGEVMQQKSDFKHSS
ncbi:MAG TPA: sensor domain-containing diguanylate cyclase [Acinetobacter johnsonii]|nr:sensor domain-containing diguanylate cyclase [Acinetobacter johnsonii]